MGCPERGRCRTIGAGHVPPPAQEPATRVALMITSLIRLPMSVPADDLSCFESVEQSGMEKELLGTGR